MRLRILAMAAALVVVASTAANLHGYDETKHGHNARWRAMYYPWHGRYYNVQYGAPLALVVPPTAELQTNYAWGSVSSRMTRIDHQFQRPWPNGFWTPYGFLPGAAWPSDTRQFGTYYVRGPW